LIRSDRLAPVIARLRQAGTRLHERWRNLSPLHQRIAMASGALVLALALFASTRSTKCATHADVEARVADVTSQLQQDAATGKLSLDQLAERIKRINAAATLFDRDSDAAAHCDALERLR
jgi:hypothetical protein